VRRLDLLQVVVVALSVGASYGCVVEEDHRDYREQRHEEREREERREHREEYCPRCGARFEAGVCVGCGYRR
jgi:hypothetical protein